MKKWADKYLPYFECPVDEIPEEIFGCVKNKLIRKQSDSPLISVVLIAHNEEHRILPCIWSILDNECDLPMEIIAVNNLSTDRTEEVLKKLGVTYYNELKKGPGFARQCGLDHAKGEYYMCIDADTLYPPQYLHTHFKKLSQKDTICTYGLWSFMPDEHYRPFELWIYENLRDIYLRFYHLWRPELCVRGMSFCFKVKEGRKVGFRTDIMRGEDGSMALALMPYGKIKLITSGKARVLTSNNTLSQDGSLTNSFRIRIKKMFRQIKNLVLPR